MAWEQNNTASSKNGDMDNEMDKGIFWLLNETDSDAHDLYVRLPLNYMNVLRFHCRLYLDQGLHQYQSSIESHMHPQDMPPFSYTRS